MVVVVVVWSEGQNSQQDAHCVTPGGREHNVWQTNVKALWCQGVVWCVVLFQLLFSVPI